MNTPLLLIAWRRPQTLRQVIDAIRPLAPTRLFIACDGPNPERLGEEEKVAATRLVIDQEIDWPCQIKRLYSDVNQGCRVGVSRAINWFFDHVEEGIILEDDCVPHPDFFPFCESLLQHYRCDTRVWCISGNNFQDGDWIGSGDYFFSQIPMCWGWATWRTRWVCYDSDLDAWPIARQVNLLDSLIPDAIMRSYWHAIWSTLWSDGTPDSWAYRWAFTCVANRGLTCLPKGNLVSNVGFGVDATHTCSGSLARSVVPLRFGSISHPPLIASLIQNDISIFDHHFGGRWFRFPLNLTPVPLRLFRKSFRRLLDIGNRP